jgi:hypothetical protein
MKNLNFSNATIALLVLIPLLCFMQCSDDAVLDRNAVISDPLTHAASATDSCSACTYIVPANTHVIDGKYLNLPPGSVIGLDASVTYGQLLFKNITGTEQNPIIIRNCNGTAIVNGGSLAYSIKTNNCRYFRITGGDTLKEYGISITGGKLGITLDNMSTNFTVDHIEIQQCGFAGIMAKTDPNCNDSTIRGNFTMKNVYFYDNYIHEVGGEGFYVGNSFYSQGMNTACGTRYPHEIHYMKIFNNIIKNSGWDGIQVGCATKGCRIYGNTVENYGAANVPNQRNGVQLGEGTGGIFYGNLIWKGNGNGMNILGLGDNVIYNNVIAETGAAGVFCDERYTPGPGFKFINNTIVNTKSDGIRIYADLVPMNVIINNIIINPATYSTYTYPRKPNDAFVYKLSKNVKIDMSHNFFSPSLDSITFLNVTPLNYRPAANSPAIDAGRDISSFGILTDFYKKTRLKGLGYDIGAVELQQVN